MPMKAGIQLVAATFRIPTSVEITHGALTNMKRRIRVPVIRGMLQKMRKYSSL